MQKPQSLAPYLAQYQRMKRAYDRLMSPPTYAPDDLEGLQTAFNQHVDNVICFFMHAWHLKDWIDNDDTIEEAKQLAAVQEAEKTLVLNACADVANGTKHLKRNSKRIRLGASLGSADFFRTRTPGRHMVVVFIDSFVGRRMAERDAAQKVVTAWEALMRKHGLL